MENQGEVGAQSILGEWYLCDCDGLLRNYIEAVRLLRLAVAQNDVEAMNSLGTAYENGQGVTRDMAAAVSLYRRAADLGLARGQFNLGLSYQYGKGLPQDDAEAAKWYGKAVEQGHNRAQHALGRMLISGSGVARDMTKGLGLLRLAAEQGNSEAMVDLGGAFLMQDAFSNPAEAMRWYRQAADKGNIKAEYLLGVQLLNAALILSLQHPETSPHFPEAILWLGKAADHNFGPAYDWLGRLHNHGQGFPRDMEKAVACFRRGAERGEANAQFSLGSAYERALGKKRDDALAVKWYRRAAAQGHSRSQYNLGMMLSQGRGGDEDYPEALFWLTLSTASSTAEDRPRTEELRAAVAQGIPAAQAAEIERKAALWQPQPDPAISKPPSLITLLLPPCPYHR